MSEVNQDLFAIASGFVSELSKSNNVSSDCVMLDGEEGT